MSGTWPGFSADWEESSEFQEAKAELRRQRQTRLFIPPAPVDLTCPRCGAEMAGPRGCEQCYADDAEAKAWASIAQMADESRPEAPLPRALREPCPECGGTVKETQRHVGGVYYVDLICPFCEWSDIDTEGGI